MSAASLAAFISAFIVDTMLRHVSLKSLLYRMQTTNIYSSDVLHDMRLSRQCLDNTKALQFAQSNFRCRMGVRVFNPFFSLISENITLWG